MVRLTYSAAYGGTKNRRVKIKRPVFLTGHFYVDHTYCIERYVVVDRVELQDLKKSTSLFDIFIYLYILQNVRKTERTTAGLLFNVQVNRKYKTHRNILSTGLFK